MARDSLINGTNGERGQTVVEYLLMLVVMATIITSILATIKTKYLGDATKCDKPAFSKTLLCKINTLIKPNGETKKFQYWPFKK
jgi:hypothetical protein